jgi:glutathionyl-hydroquinone reductase
MGVMIDGQWHDQWYDTSAHGVRFVRPDAQFRHWVTADGAPGPSGEGGFRPVFATLSAQPWYSHSASGSTRATAP